MPGLRVFQRSLAPPTTPPQDHAPAYSHPSKDHLAVHSPQISPGSSIPSSTSSLTPTPSRHDPNPGLGPDVLDPPNQLGEGRRVMSRLHALFNAPFPGPEGKVDPDLSRSRTAPAPSTSQTSPLMNEPEDKEGDAKDRNAIKVLIVTWNMGEQLPKGDLAVLLGDVPAYDGAHSTGTLPELPTEHKHPYHIVVIAGQECPTDSGVPRGWGGGLMKGVRAAHKKHKEEKKGPEKGKEGSVDKTEVSQDQINKPESEQVGEDKDEKNEEESQDAKMQETGIVERLKEEAEGMEQFESEQLDKIKREKDKLGKPKSHQTEVERLKDEQHGLGLGLKSPVSPNSRSPHSPMARSMGAMSDESSTDGHSKSPLMMDEDDGRMSRGLSPSPSMDRSHGSLLLHKPVHHPGSKGWSTMLDDWFCGPSARRPDENQEESLTQPTPSPVPPSGPISPPPMNRSVSAPTSASLSPPQILSLSPGRLAVPLSRSPLSRALTSRGSPSSDSSSASSPMSDIPNELLFGSPPNISLPPASGTAPIDIPGQRARRTESADKPMASAHEMTLEMPELVVPPEERRTVGGEKCYLHLIKERLMGMYLSVYVYKGCEHLIQGVDKDFVTAGLAGGRVGNKGGIGISLKLADHRFLFVNSHLAAHTARVNARLANIAKIKADLRLDTFLPKHDPLHELQDLTDRFDTVFWCGDLNFRLDLSRLHAEWLVEKKKYSEALMWDQLQNTMKDEQKNPFPGFAEHTIDFPPTFKYDVWRSVKSSNRELRRTIKRRGTVTSTHSKGQPEMSVAPLRDDLGHIAEAPDQERDSDARSVISRRDSDEDTRTINSRRSFDSSVCNSAVPSTAGTDVSDAESLYRQPVDATAYGSKQKALEVAIKSKTKRLLGIVKMEGMFGHSPKRHSRRASKGPPMETDGRPSADFDSQSRRTSVSSIATMLSQDGHESVLNNPPETPVDNGVPNRPRAATSASASDASRPRPKRRLTLKRATTLRRRAHTEGEEGAEGLEEDDEFDSTDRREGVYDTSKKQRVPSWCDRVLWKTRVTPDPPSGPPSPDLESLLEHDTNPFRPFNRLSQAFVNIGGHLRLPVTRSVTISAETDRPGPSRLFSSLGQRGSVERRGSTPPVDHPGPSLLVTSPEASPMPILEDQISPHNMTGMIPSPRRTTLAQPVERPALPRAPSSSPHPLLDAVPTTSPPADPKVTFDAAVSASSAATRRRANSDSLHSRPNGLNHDLGPSLSPTAEESPRARPTDAGPSRRLSFPRHASISRHSSYERKLKNPRRTSGSLRIRKRTQTLDSMTSNTSSKRSPVNLLRHTFAVPNHIDRPERRDMRDDDANAFVKFFKDIPSWLHRGSVPVPLAELETLPQDEAKRRRHQRGEVECLHYGTIDDTGMRLLEGRSDHRPAIFSAAVYVD